MPEPLKDYEWCHLGQVVGGGLDFGADADEQVACVEEDGHQRRAQVLDLFAHGFDGFAQGKQDDKQNDGLNQQGQRRGADDEELDSLSI